MSSSMSPDPADQLDDLLLVTEHAQSGSSLAESISSLSSESLLSPTELVYAGSLSVTPSTVSELSERSTVGTGYSDTFETVSTEHSIHTDEHSASDTDYSYSDDFTGSRTQSLPSTVCRDEQRMRQLFVTSQLRQLQVSRSLQIQKPEVDPARRQFCSRMVQKLRRKSSGLEPVSASEEAVTRTVHRRDVPAAFLDRVKIACLRSNMKAELEKEETTTDLYVRRKLEEQTTRRNFIHNAAERIRSKMIDRQLSDPSYQDSILMYADLLNSLPNPREPRSDIWRQLLKPLREREQASVNVLTHKETAADGVVAADYT